MSVVIFLKVILNQSNKNKFVQMSFIFIFAAGKKL
jgi:hypothetical protein